MTAATLRWRPVCDRAIARLMDQVQSGVDAWRAQWWSPAPRCQVRSAPWPPDEANFALAGTALALASPWVDARTHGPAWGALTRHALGIHPPTGDPDTQCPTEVLAHVAAQIADDLVQRLGLSGEAAPTAGIPHPPAAWRHGGVRLDIEAPTFGRLLSLRFAQQYFWALPPRQAAVSRPVLGHGVHEALQDTTLALHVSLGACRLSARELLDMSPGDLLMPDGAPDALALHLLNRDQPLPAFAHGVLGRTGSRLAVQLTRMEPLP